jgi:hypothetical protein
MEGIGDIRVSSKLSNAKPALEGDTLTLAFNSTEAEICAEAIRANSARIEELASGILGAPTRVAIEVVKSRTPTKRELTEKALSDPIIQQALELFEGRVVDVRQAEENPKNGG